MATAAVPVDRPLPAWVNCRIPLPTSIVPLFGNSTDMKRVPLAVFAGLTALSALVSRGDLTSFAWSPIDDPVLDPLLEPELAVGRPVYGPKEGMQVRARGRVSLYEPRGSYQFIVEQLENMMPHKGKKFLPLVGTVFVFILLQNFIASASKRLNRPGGKA